MGFGGDNDDALGNVNDVITEGFGHRVQRHGAFDKSLDKFETAHCSFLVFIDDPKMSLTNCLRHEFHRTLIGGQSVRVECRIGLEARTLRFLLRNSFCLPCWPVMEKAG
jgi:hypothetical protein